MNKPPRSRNSKPAAIELRRKALLEHARAEFVKHGIHGVSLNEVARLAGGSKATIVKLFGSKAGLFSALIAEELAQLSTSIDYEGIMNPSELTIGDSLFRLGHAILRSYLTPEGISIYRSLIGGGEEVNELARRFYQDGQLKHVSMVASILEHWRGMGIRSDADIMGEAGRFTHMLRSGIHERAVLGLTNESFGEMEVEEIARATTHLFLYGIMERPSVGMESRVDDPDL